MKKLFVVLFACLAFAGSAIAVTVDLNSADQAQLETVKGIGPVKAKAVIDYRAKNGPFKTIDDLEKVSGFGKKTVDSVRSQVTVGGGAAAGRMEKKPEAKPDKGAEKKSAEKKPADGKQAESKKTPAK